MLKAKLMIKKSKLKSENQYRRQHLEIKNMSTAVTLVKIIFLSFAILIAAGCSLFSSDESILKNKNVQVEAPSLPFEEVDVTSADRVWQNKVNGNTMAYNSACEDAFKKQTVDALEENILSGVDEIKIFSKEKIKIDGTDGERTRAEGQVENVKVMFELITYKKGNCAFDLAYVGRVSTFSKDLVSFEHFADRFHTP
jgi:hypothetical protein